MALQLVSRHKNLGFATIASAETFGLEPIVELQLPSDNTKSYVFTLLVRNLQKEQTPRVPVDAQDFVFRYGDIGGGGQGYGGTIESTYALPAAAKAIVVRSNVFTITNAGSLEPQFLYLGPGAVVGRDDMFFETVEVCIWSIDQLADLDDLWDEGVTLLVSNEPADVETEIKDKLTALVNYHTAGVTVGGYKPGIVAPAPTTIVTAASRILDVVTGTGGTARFTTYALSQSPTADLTATNAAIVSLGTSIGNIPTNPLLADDSRLNNLDAPVSAPVMVGGYLPGQEPTSTIDYSAEFTSVLNAVGNIPTNPLLATDNRLDNLDAPVSGAVTVGGYSIGQSPADLVDLAPVLTAIGGIPTNPLLTNDSRLGVLDSLGEMIITSPFGDKAFSTLALQYAQNNDYTSELASIATAIAAIPTNPLLTNDARITSIVDGVAAIPTNPVLETDTRLHNLDAPVSMPVIVGGYVSGVSPTFSDAAILAAIGNIPTNPLLTNDARLNNLDAPVSGSVTVAGYASGQSPADLVDLAPLTTAVAAIPTNPLLANDARLDNLDAQVSLTLTAAAYTAPDNTGITAAKNAAETVRDQRTLLAANYATDAKQDSIISQLGAVQSGVSARLTVITSSQYALPASGTVDYSILVQSNDASGQPVDLDSAALPVVTAFAGAVDRSAKLSTVTKQSTGRYRLTYTVDVGDTVPESIIIKATGTQSSTAYSAESVVTVSDFATTDYTTADRTRDDNIESAITALQTAVATLSTFDPDTDDVTVGGYAVGQSPADLAPTADLTATNSAIASIATSVGNIPTNPLLTNDSRIDALSTFDAASDLVKLDLTQTLSNSQTLDTALTQVGSFGSGANKLTVTAVDENSVVIPNVLIDLLDNAGDRLGIFGLTDPLGKVEFNVASNSYKLTIRSTPGLSLASPLAVAVSADTASQLTLTRTTTTLPPTASMCVVEDYVLDSQFNPVPNAQISATVSSGAKLVNAGIATQIRASAVSDATGRFQLVLPRKNQFTAGALYTITIQSVTSASIYRTITGVIPNQNTCLLKDIEGVLA